MHLQNNAGNVVLVGSHVSENNTHDSKGMKSFGDEIGIYNSFLYYLFYIARWFFLKNNGLKYPICNPLQYVMSFLLQLFNCIWDFLFYVYTYRLL